MKKNKGFSLVELIIVIAIMAILAAAIAPALIRYIDKSRKASDVSTGGTIQTAVQAALANELAYDEIISVVGTDASGIYVLGVQGSTLASPSGMGSFGAEMASSLTDNFKVKYKKDQQSAFNVYVTGTGTVKVFAATTTGGNANTAWQLVPSVGASYQ